MTPRTWKLLAFVLSSVAYWSVALAFWFYTVLTYGECFPPQNAGPSYVNVCQNEKVRFVWGTLAVIGVVYLGGIWFVRAASRSKR